MVDRGRRKRRVTWGSAIRGKFVPTNVYKYKGDAKRITYRSMWERRFMLYCDRSDQIVTWSSEEIHIPYISPKDSKWHNYYPDFFIHTCDDRKIMIEIKPNYQKSWNINKSKWSAAKEYCLSKGWEFKVLTEKELF